MAWRADMSSHVPGFLRHYEVSATTLQESTIIWSRGAVGGRAGLAAVERLSLLLVDDLRALTRKTRVTLDEALGAPPHYGGDPDLYLRLVYADLERILRQQLATGMIVLVMGREERTGVTPTLYRAIYRICPVMEPAAEEPTPVRVARVTGELAKLADDAAIGSVALVADWSRDPAMQRPHLLPPHYHFAWRLAAPATIDDQQCPPNRRYDWQAGPPGALFVLRIDGSGATRTYMASVGR